MKTVLPLLLSVTIAAAAFGEPRLDPTKLAEVPKRMQEFVDRGEIAGAVTLVSHHGRVAQLAAVGKSDLGSGRAMKTDDLFWIASMTKPMTAVCVLILQDEGKL